VIELIAALNPAVAADIETPTLFSVALNVAYVPVATFVVVEAVAVAAARFLVAVAA